MLTRLFCLPTLLALVACSSGEENTPLEDTGPDETGLPDSGDTDDTDDTDADTDSGDTDDTDAGDTDDTDTGDTDDTGATAPCTTYADADGDGFGDPDTVSCDGVSDATDCDDTRADVFPGAAEVCDAVDQDCDGAIDEGAAARFADADGDGFGDASTVACTPEGGVENGDDCDDADATVYPDAPELCDAQENDCAGDGVYDDGGVCEMALPDATRSLMSGSTASENASTPVPGGDLDGDGIPDLLVLSYVAAYVVSGADALDSAAIDLADSAVALASDGSSGSAPWFSGAAVPDMDGDGRGELVFGDPQSRYEDYYNYRGGAWIVRGMPGSGALNDVAAALLYDSSEPGGYAGYAVGSLGDTDGDGVGEVLVGAPYAEGSDGKVWMVGADVTGEVDAATDADAIFTGATADAGAGRGVTGAGDVDGDGLEDLLISGTGARRTASSEGAVWLLRAPFADSVDLSDADAVLWGGTADAGYGVGLAALGDADGDGLDDFAVSAPAGSRSGWVDIWSGTITGEVGSSSAAGRVQGGARDGVGYSVAGPGDIDGDGLGDLAVAASAYASNGAVFVWYHGVSGTVVPADANVTLLTSERYGGAEVSNVGDVDGDGRPDLLVGTPGDSREAAYAGSTSLVLGGVW